MTTAVASRGASSATVTSTRAAETGRSVKRRHRIRSVLFWVLLFLGSAAVYLGVGSLAEGAAPWTWLPRFTPTTTEAIGNTAAVATVFFGGVWLAIIVTGLLRLGLRYGSGPMAVARTVVDEALRNRVVVVVMLVLLLALAVLPAGGGEQPLRYRVQTFLIYSNFVAATVLGVVTILFGAWTTAGELSARRAGDVFVKPVSRLGYLVGKWLGITALNVAFVAVVLAVTFFVSRMWLANSYAVGLQDRELLNSQVLTARTASTPQPPVPFEITARRELERLAEVDPSLVEQRGAANLYNDLILQATADWYSIAPRDQQTYVFEGLAGVKARAEVIMSRLRDRGLTEADLQAALAAGEIDGIDIKPAVLQLRFEAEGNSPNFDQRQPMILTINGRSRPFVVQLDILQEYSLPATLVGDDGRLELTVTNNYPREVEPPIDPQTNQPVAPPTLKFSPDEAIQILYVDGSFGGNLVRQHLVLLGRLVFLAMLAVTAGSLLSYPVAAVLSLAVWLLAAGGATLQEMLSGRVAETELMPVDTFFNNFLVPAVRMVSEVLSLYSRIDAADAVANGRLVPLETVGQHWLWVAVLWTGIALGIGYALFRRREIAAVQV